MSNITGKIAKKAALGVLVVAAVAVAGGTTAHAATHHDSVVSHSIASADNNNPGPDGAHSAPIV